MSDEMSQQEKDQQAEQARILQKQRQLILDIKETFSPPAGQRVMEFLEGYVGYGYPSYQVGNANAEKDAIFFDGRKDPIKLLKTQIEAKLPDEDDKPTTAE